MNRITRALLIGGAALLVGISAAAAETFPIECAHRDVQLVTQMEQHGEAQDVPGEILYEAYWTVKRAPRGLLPGPGVCGALRSRQHLPPVARRPDTDAMISMDNTHPANAGIDADRVRSACVDSVRDAGASVRRSRFARSVARCVERLLRALHESRRLEGERVMACYRHLNCDSERSDSGD